MIRFRDRREAGRMLGAALRERAYSNPIVLGIPRGGVVIAGEVARELGGQAGVIVTRKIGAPDQPEFAIGAVTADGSAWLDPALVRVTGADRAYVDRAVAAATEEAKRREAAYDHRNRLPVQGRTAIIVDDGLATGATARAALRAARSMGAERLVLAVPVAPPRAVAQMELEADDVVVLVSEEDFYAVGQFYRDFRPVSDDEVQRVLSEQADGSTERRTVTIERDGISLAGVFIKPAGLGPFPCVVFAHGLGSSKDSPRNMPIAEHLLDEGIASLLFDLSGHGDSGADPRGDEAYCLDLAAAYEWVRSKPSIAADRIGIAGSSLGGVVALDAQQQGLVSAQTMVLRAPPLEPGALGGLTVPVLVLCGELDPLRLRIESEVRKYDHAALSVVPKAGHLFEEPGALDEALARTVRWFQRVLAAASR